MPPDAIKPETSERVDQEDEHQETSGSDVPAKATQDEKQQAFVTDPPVHVTFDIVLASTRVYNRVQDREVDAMSSVSTTRSHAWSVLSGVSLAQISLIAVISLPLHESELERFRRLTSLAAPAVPVIRTGAVKRIEKELTDIGRDPPSCAAAGPIGEDMVMFQLRTLVIIAADMY